MTEGDHQGHPAVPMFFILSRPRTGSTLLRTLLDAHPNTLVPPECQFIINLYPRFRKIHEWSRDDISRLVQALPGQFLFDTWKMDMARLERDLLPLAGEIDYAGLCRQIYLHYQSIYPKSGIKLIGDKNPAYALYAEQLLELFPEARFIHLYRDYRDNHLSLVEAGFELPLISLTTGKWRHFYRRVSAVQRRHPDRVLNIRYEDLAGNPETVLRSICTFLGLPWEASMLDFHDNSEDMIRLYSDHNFLRFHRELLNPVNESRVGLWHEGLSPTQVQVADLVAGRDAENAGYQRRFRGFHPLTAVRAAPGMLSTQLIYWTRALVDHLPWRLRQAFLIHASARVEALWRRLFGTGKRD